MAIVSNWPLTQRFLKSIEKSNCKGFSTYSKAEEFLIERFREQNPDAVELPTFELDRIFKWNSYYAVWGVWGVGVYDSFKKMLRAKKYLGPKSGYEEFDTFQIAESIALFNYNIAVDKINPLDDFKGPLTLNKIIFRKEIDPDYAHYDPDYRHY